VRDFTFPGPEKKQVKNPVQIREIFGRMFFNFIQ
jgi:hypothetical protein